MRRLFLPAALALATACAPDVLTPPAPGAALRARATGGSAEERVTVQEADVVREPDGAAPAGEWVLYSRLAGTGAFRAGPITPPLGSGSIELATPGVTDRVALLNYGERGVALHDITALRYATFRTAGMDNQDAALTIEIDANGAAPGGLTSLTFVPQDNLTTSAVLTNTWQTWDALRGGAASWRSSEPIPGATTPGATATWSAIVAANPDAVIAGGIGPSQGAGTAALTVAVDALHLETATRSVTWDFELFGTASSTGDCKDGGWQQLRRLDGTPFRNQGDCVSYQKK